jgi:hypothetical protein
MENPEISAENAAEWERPNGIIFEIPKRHKKRS